MGTGNVLCGYVDDNMTMRNDVYCNSVQCILTPITRHI